MNFSITRLIIELVTFDMNLWVIAKSIQTNRLDGERSSKLAKYILSNEKKKTYIHYSILIVNLALVLLETISAFVVYINSGIGFLQAVTDICEQIMRGWRPIFLGVVFIGMLTIFFMVLAYRAVRIGPMIDSMDSNRHLSADEVNKEYINFSKPDCIDGRSTLLLIAGDLSFLGDIPDIKNIKNTNRRKKCEVALSDNSSKRSFCKRNCPTNIKQKCMEKSGQFMQLFDLKNKEIFFRIICKQPKDKGDTMYKRRLGRLKTLFPDNIDIRFLPEDTLGNGICVLGRIKRNGGIDELFWHWKDTRNAGTYTVPNTKKADSSENKTLIYLLGTMLWESAEEINDEKLNEYIEEYEKAIK